VLVAAIAAKVAGADDFQTYPTIEVGLSAATLALASLVAVSGLAPLRRRPRRRARAALRGGRRAAALEAGRV